MTVLLVTGARSIGPEDAELVRRTLDRAHHRACGQLVVFVGDASGVDAVARDWARERRLRLHTYLAEWDRHGRAAGPKRNEEMVSEAAEYPSLIALAFPGPRSIGTWDCMKRIVAHGREISRVIPVGVSK